MAEFSSRSGRRVSEYRKRFYHQSAVMGNVNSPAILTMVNNQNRITQLKHLRGEIAIGPSNPSIGTSIKYSRGIVGLVRYPTSETLSVGDLTTEASWFLHPVTYVQHVYPVMVEYTFKAITLGEREKLYLVVWPSYQSTTMLANLEFLWDERLTITSDS